MSSGWYVQHFSNVSQPESYKAPSYKWLTHTKYLKGHSGVCLKAEEPRICCPQAEDTPPKEIKLKCSERKARWDELSCFPVCSKHRGNGLCTWTLAPQAWKGSCGHRDAWSAQRGWCHWKGILVGVKEFECVVLIYLFRKIGVQPVYSTVSSSLFGALMDL